MIRRSVSGRIITVLLAVMLVTAFPAPINAAGEDQWYDSIPSMLSAGQYEEGVVIAGIDMSKAVRPEDPGSALETKKLRAASEAIMTVDAGDASADSDLLSWLRRLKDWLTGRNADGVCITSIRRKDMTTEQILRTLADDDSVVFAEPNYIKSLESLSGNDPADQGDAAANAAAREASALQWSSSESATLHAAGKNGNVSMKVPGWPAGSNMEHKIIAAVVDMPVDFTNPDLEGVAYTFSPEQQALLGCDDHGFNAIWESKNGKLDYDGAGSHGTHVAGIIGAEWDGRGISGAGSKVEIVSVQNSKDGMTSLIDSLNGYSFIKNAVDIGIKIRIVNNSWGLQQSSRALDAAVTELGEHGVISFFAAGNDGDDLNAMSTIVSTLGNNPYAVIVASTKPDGTISDFSSYGRGIVTLGAPGECILSCIRPAEAEYMPVLSGTNKVYENFESDGAAKVKLCQVGYNEDGSPDSDGVVSGTDGTVVTGPAELGFEGQKVLKIRFDRAHLGGDYGRTLAVRMDFEFSQKRSFTSSDGVGFAFGGKGTFFPESTEIAGKPESRTETDHCYNYPGSWGSYSYTFKENISADKLSFICQIYVPKDEDEVYFDAIGIGDEKQPYAFMSGTSMATPAAAGAAAVIASRHHDELTGMDSASAKKLASLVRSSVRPNASLAGKTSTGGIIDLTVDEKDNARAETPGPDITDLTISGRTVTLTGANFGETGGSVKVGKYVLGAPSDAGSSVTRWSGSKVVLTLDKDFEGIIEAVLTASNGKKDTIVKYISKSSNIFEKDHHIGSDTGKPFVFDEPGPSDPGAETLGDFETSGILAAGDGRLWYLPNVAKVEVNAACKNMYSYDPVSGSWSVCPALPEWIRIASGTWFDGRIYVKGTTAYVDDSGTIPYSDPYTGKPYGTCVYSYKPGDSSWTKCSSEGVAPELTLFAAGGRLMLAGATTEESKDESAGSYPSVRGYDPASGAGKPLGHLPCSAIKPKAAYAGGHVYLFDFESGKLFVLDGSMSAGKEDVIGLPEFCLGDTGGKSLREYDLALLSYGDMLILTGPAANGGPSDTFTLYDGERSLSPFSRRVSDAKVHMPAAAVLDGRLYVIAASAFEPDLRIFRSTALPKPDAERFTITYDLNGGSFDGSAKAIREVYEKGTVISVHEAPEREGYVFRYWKGSRYDPGDEYTVTENHTFTAQWDKKGAGGGGTRTGDGSHLRIWALFAFLAVLGIAAMAVIRRRR
ncbi:MAG: S8 family serine peptidase [Mogibacterium sp.]|nr:S8 family serine peptidase [Mogibacterium sp.]